MGSSASVDDSIHSSPSSSPSDQQQQQQQKGCCLYGEYGRQLSKPVDGSDLKSLKSAKAEISRLRFMLSCSNLNPNSDVIVERVEEEGSASSPRTFYRARLKRSVSVPSQMLATPPKVIAPMRLSRGLRQLGIDFKEYAAQLHKADDSLFTDEDFPPGISSLYSEESSLTPEKRKQWNTYEWRRIGSGTAGGDLFVNGISPQDIIQGQLGDCYFLSSLAVLAEYPDRIKSLFLRNDTSAAGCYGVRYCINGQWEEVVIDDHVPFDPETNSPAFANPSAGAEKWVLLLEKAWAKLNGSYHNIQGGDPGLMLRILTGATTSMYEVNDPEIWPAMMEAERQRFVTTATVYEHPGDLQMEFGIVENHAYAVLGVYEIPQGRSTLRLVEIRNPWGQMEWKGDYSDSSPLWNEELKQRVNYENTDDGIFFMAFYDFVKVFSVIHVCELSDNLARVNTTSFFACDPEFNAVTKLEDGQLHPFRRACVLLDIPTSGDYAIAVHQRDNRAMAQGSVHKEHNYCAVKFWITRIGDGEKSPYAFVAASPFMQDREVFIKNQHLSTGKYYVFVVGALLADLERTPFVLSCYGPSAAKVEVLHSGGREKFANSENSVWDHVSKNMISAYRDWTRSSETVYRFEGASNIVMYSWYTPIEGVACFLYENQSTDSTLKETVDFSMENMRVTYVDNCTVGDDQSACKIDIGPGKSAFIVVEQVSNDVGFQYNFSRTFRIV